ncbi:MAG: T9SS type A sorting domain-containing protein [bacterium]|nr:T9SS type A sorting domain-containing protein [bacterium]
MKNVYIILVIFGFFLAPIANAQEIQIITHGMTKYEPVGTLEIVIDFEVVNISQFEQTIFEVRTIDNMPAGWSSSLCFGDLCFAPFVDSVATTPDFQTPPVAPGDTLKTSIHIFTDQISVATAHVQIEVGTFRNPDDRFVLDFTGTTDPTVSVTGDKIVNAYELYQNYPNPFNPSTRINYKVGEPGLVQLKVYNVLGVEVASLVNEFRNAGDYFADFEARDISSGIYFYTLSINNFTQTRKMILEK